TLWAETSDAAFVSLLQRRLPNVQVKASHDALRVHAVSRVLHYPGYALGQLEYYRAQYDAARFAESANAPDLLPISGAVLAAYEQTLLGRAVGALQLRAGESHLAIAQRLVSSDAVAQFATDLAPRLSVRGDVERHLRALLEDRTLSPFDRGIVGTLLKRYAAVV
ncbi:MAG TPA: hypothetical protein VF698_08755, partial [Thermoanaerobaculia bacterium]